MTFAEDRLRLKRLCEVVPNPAGGWLNIRHIIWAAAQGSNRTDHPALDCEAAQTLILKLGSSLDTGFPTPTLASSSYMRSVRQAVCGAALAALSPLAWENMRTFTIINAGWVFRPKELDHVSAQRIKKQLRIHLNRIGIKADTGFFLAFLHGEFDPIARLYTLHFHGVTTAEIAELLKKLVGKWGYVQTRTGARPIVCKRIKDPVPQISYLLKAYWPSRGFRQLPNGVRKRDRKGRRIPEPYQTQVLLWLDRQRLSDLTVMIGGWSRRKGGNDAMRRLYFSTVEG